MVTMSMEELEFAMTYSELRGPLLLSSLLLSQGIHMGFCHTRCPHKSGRCCIDRVVPVRLLLLAQRHQQLRLSYSFHVGPQ